jgi:predicted transcriptional regulator
MSANILSNEREHEFALALESPRKLEWVVRQNLKLQAELNGQPKTGKKLSSKIVNKVVDRIKDL